MSKFKLNKREKFWILYDVGNSAFTMLVSTPRPDLRQTLPVVFKKAVVDRQQLWCEVKQYIRQKERRDKNIAPLCIADFGPFGFQFGCFCRLHQNSSSYSQT